MQNDSPIVGVRFPMPNPARLARTYLDSRSPDTVFYALGTEPGRAWVLVALLPGQDRASTDRLAGHPQVASALRSAGVPRVSWSVRLSYADALTRLTRAFAADAGVGPLAGYIPMVPTPGLDGDDEADEVFPEDYDP